MKYIESPEIYTNDVQKSLFLAGGITKKEKRDRLIIDLRIGRAIPKRRENPSHRFKAAAIRHYNAECRPGK